MPLTGRFFSLALILILLSSLFPLLTAPATAQAASWVNMTGITTQDLNAVWGSACNNVYAVGANGTMIRFNGHNWSTVNTGTSTGLQGIWGSSASNIFVVGWSGTILHFDGANWTAMTSGTANDLYAVWGNAPNSVFAVGSRQTIQYWNGAAWTNMPTPGDEATFYAVWGTAYNNVYTVGTSGIIYHFNGAGWSAMTSPTGYTLYGLWGSSPSDIWAGGDTTNSRIHFDGSAWSGGLMPLFEYYRGAWGTSSTDVYFAGHTWMSGGGIYHYNGSSWGLLTAPGCANLNAIWGSSADDIFSVGDSGTILHYGGCSGSASAALTTTLGTVNLNTSVGFITNASWLAPGNMRCSNPSGFYFPWGMFSFNITNLIAGQAARVTLKFSNPLPLGIKYYKCINGTMVDCTSLITRVDEYTLILALTDGGPGDADGAANGTIVDPGGPAYPLAVTQSSSAQMPVTAPQQPVQLSNISVKSASLSASKVAPGETVTVTASVANTGAGNGTSQIKLYINGAEAAKQGVSVNSGGSTTVIFDVTRNEPGTYTVYVGGTNAGSFTVDDFTLNTILFISGALVFFALVLGIIWMTRRIS